MNLIPMKRRGGATLRETEQSVAVLVEETRDSAAPGTAPKAAADDARAHSNPWVIVLAGGEGSRVRAYTTLQDGVPVPKQFCHFRDERTLLGTTVARALRLTTRERVVVVVVEAHRQWWRPELAHLPSVNVLSQPANRGTGVAILHALLHIYRTDPSPRVVVMPSDHDFEDESALIGSVARAMHTAESFPAAIVLLGIAPSHLDAEYGLIVPGAGTPRGSRPVRAFVEKPTLSTAAQLARAGALWNSFIFSCTGAALYGAFEAALPSLIKSYLDGLTQPDDGITDAVAAFEQLPECDFSRDVLQRNAGRLRLVEVPNCGWTDLGTPARLAAWLEGHREALFWREHGMTRQQGTDGLWGALQAGGA